MEKMSEEYKSKHYPQGSVMEKAAAENRRGNVILAVMAALVSAGLGWLIFWLASLTMDHRAQGNDDSAQMGVIFIAVIGVILALCLFGLVFAIRHIKDGKDMAIRKAAKFSQLTEDEVREFDRQAMQSDSSVFRLAGKVSAAMSGQKDGILTRDYIWLGAVQNCILKREDIVGACLYWSYYYVNRKRISNLNLALLSRNGVTASAETQEEAARELLQTLREAHPAIQVQEGTLKEGKEFDRWRDSLRSGSN